jgi:hypothetical protein
MGKADGEAEGDMYLGTCPRLGRRLAKGAGLKEAG